MSLKSPYPPPRGIITREPHLQHNFQETRPVVKIEESDRDALRRIVGPPANCPNVTEHALQVLAAHRGHQTR